MFILKDKNTKIEEKSTVSSGVKLEVFNFIIIAVATVVTITLSIIVYMAHTTYNAFYSATEEYINCRTSADQIHEASEYLTNEVRAFTFTGNTEHLENYFTEANVSKRRERAINAIKQYVNNEDKDIYLEDSVKFSKDLMNIEFYAMRLVLEANKTNYSYYPEEIKAVNLKEEDKALSVEEKTLLAQKLVQDEIYNDYKDKIYKNVSLYTKDLLDDTRNREIKNSNLFSCYQLIQMILIVVLIATLILNVSFTSVLLIKPLRKSSKLIVRQNSMPIKGSQEIRTFARLYNKVLEKTKTQQEKLSYDASHDSLTGIQNRAVFDEMYKTINNTEDIALILADIDNFKTINDTYGHEIGDKVLQKIASNLHNSFRTDDIICRIGGDEFTIIMNGVSNDYKDQLQGKMEFLLNHLNTGNDNLPNMTMSIGIAFGSKDLNFNELYKNADKALYKVKTTTKNNVAFFD